MTLSSLFRSGLTAMALIVLQSVAAQSAKESRSSYYRIKVDLEYAGRPFRFDVVVGCGVTVSRYSFGGTSIDTMSASATSFALATSDGHAIAVQTLPPGIYRFCDGATTANGQVPADYMPLVVWFERADLLGQGIGYRTPAAYANPKSPLKFHGAKVESASPQDFETFQASGTKNLFPLDQVDWLTRRLPPLLQNGEVPKAFVEHPLKAWPYLGKRWCHGVARARLTEGQQQLVRAHWPATRPRFWQPTEQWDWLSLGQLVPGPERDFQYNKFGISQFYQKGVEVYPASLSYNLDAINPDTYKDGKYYFDISTDKFEASAGLLTCSQYPVVELEEAITHRSTRNSNRSTNLLVRVNGDVMIHRPQLGESSYYWIFERDDYVITFISPVPF